MKRIFFLVSLYLIFVPIFAGAASSIASRMEGKILLQVESKGEAWYVRQGKRYYLKDGSAAYDIMRSFGLGITNGDLAKIPSVSSTDELKKSSSACSANTFARKMAGRILLQVQQKGEAWYVDVGKCKRMYMANGAAAYQIMRYLGLGITNADLSQIPSLDQTSTLPDDTMPTSGPYIKVASAKINVNPVVTQDPATNKLYIGCHINASYVLDMTHTTSTPFKLDSESNPYISALIHNPQLDPDLAWVGGFSIFANADKISFDDLNNVVNFQHVFKSVDLTVGAGGATITDVSGKLNDPKKYNDSYYTGYIDLARSDASDMQFSGMEKYKVPLGKCYEKDAVNMALSNYFKPPALIAETEPGSRAFLDRLNSKRPTQSRLFYSKEWDVNEIGIGTQLSDSIGLLITLEHASYPNGTKDLDFIITPTEYVEGYDVVGTDTFGSRRIFYAASKKIHIGGEISFNNGASVAAPQNTGDDQLDILLSRIKEFGIQIVNISNGTVEIYVTYVPRDKNDLSAWHEYKNPIMGITLKYPPDYAISQLNSTKQRVAFDQIGTQLWTVPGIMMLPNDKGYKTIDEYLKSLDPSMIQSQKNVVIGGHAAIRVVTNDKYADNLYAIYTFTLVNGKIYIINDSNVLESDGVLQTIVFTP